MCYYNGNKVTHTEFIRLKQLEKFVANLTIMTSPLISGFDYGNTPVLKPMPGIEDFQVVPMEWGFLPSNLKNRDAAWKFRHDYVDEKGVFHKSWTTLNAKAENLFFNEKGSPSMFRFSAMERRCLVLSSGFYEWRHVYPLNKKTGQPLKTAIKYPYHITVKNREYFYMAGIWNPWKDQETGEYVETVAIVTTPANRLMQQVHNSKMRMPTILNEDLGYEWLFGKLSEERITEIALTQFPAQEMEACTIAKDFQSALDPTAPFEFEGLAPLELSY